MHMLYLGIGLVGLALVLMLAGLVTRSRAKRILSVPLLRTAQGGAMQGIASFEGVVRTQQPMMAPCSGKPCVYFELKIEHNVKEQRGNTTTTQWKTIGQAHFGSAFWLDDGSGPVVVAAQDKLDADLQTAYSGRPPGGAGLGPLSGFVTHVAHGREEVLDYRVTEKIIGVDGRLFALGPVQGGQLGPGKLTVSTRGRDALIGSARRLAVLLLAASGLAAAAGVAVAIVRPGEEPLCGALVDTQTGCVVKTELVEDNETQPDGSKKLVKLHRQTLAWEVTQPGKFEIGLHPPHRENRPVNPVAQVEDSLGLPMNIGMNLGLRLDTQNNFKTKTAMLAKGSYKIYAMSLEVGPEELVLSISRLPDPAPTGK